MVSKWLLWVISPPYKVFLLLPPLNFKPLLTARLWTISLLFLSKHGTDINALAPVTESLNNLFSGGNNDNLGQVLYSSANWGESLGNEG
jgi:hypothetical protein